MVSDLRRAVENSDNREPESDSANMHASAAKQLTVEHAIIGTGFSGLAVALALAKSNMHDMIILERGHKTGGVWRDNRYWGCACDVPSHLYSLASLPSAEWTRRYPRQEEVLAYLQQGFAQAGLEQKCRFGCEVLRLVWDEEALMWTIELSDGTHLRSRYVHAGTGQLPRRTLPDVKGLSSFDGLAFHSAQWPEVLDLTGKRVGVVGTGASGVQLIPEVARAAESMVVFQRQAPYVMPRGDRAFTRFERALLRFRPWREAYRVWLYVQHEASALAFFSFASLLAVVRHHTARAIRRHLTDPRMRVEATPRYGAGCKRVLVSDDYYPALAQPNVELVASPLEAIEGNTAIAGDGRRRELDVLIFATGFDGTLPMPGITVVGRSGRILHTEWQETGVKAFYGTQIAGYPNLFLLIGPNVGLAHNSVIYMMESQVELIMCTLSWSRRFGRPAEVNTTAQANYNNRLAKLMARTPWQRGRCISWYHDKQGRNVGLWPNYTFLFRAGIRRLNPSSQVDMQGD